MLEREMYLSAGGAEPLTLWRRATAAESAYSLETGQAPTPTGPALVTDTDPNPSRINVNGAQYVILRLFLKVPGGAATKAAGVTIAGFHGDGKQRAILVMKFSASIDSSATDIGFNPRTGAAEAGWFEVMSAAYVAGLGQLTYQNDASGTVQQLVLWSSTCDCPILVPRITTMASGVTEAVLLGGVSGRPRVASVTEL